MTIAFDESGNTGGDLVSEEQPIFCLSSVHMEPEHVQEAESLFQKVQTKEWKFSKLRQSRAHVRSLIDLLKRPWMSSERVRVYPIHKRFMIVTKFVDLLHEPMARQEGVDLYRQGAALALANLITTVLPVSIGVTRFDRLMRAFVACLRDSDAALLGKFEREVTGVHLYLSKRNRDLAEIMAPARLACKYPERWHVHTSRDELDPIVPAYFTLISLWGNDGREFTVLADESKALARHREHFMTFADQSLPKTLIPATGGNWIKYPLPVREIVLAKSEESRAVQIADLIAGAACYCLAPQTQTRDLDSTRRELLEIFTSRPFFAGGIWPSSDVTPEGVEAEHVTGETAVDYAVRVASRL